MDVEKCDWDKFAQGMDRLAELLAARINEFDSIYGIPKGGLIPAVVIANKLSKPLILDKKDITYATLIIDDICDTGKTLSKLPKTIMTATLYYKENDVYKPTYWIYKKTEKWIEFPWEV